MDHLLTKLSEQQALLAKHEQQYDAAMTDKNKNASYKRGSSSTNSELMTPASDSLNDEYNYKEASSQAQSIKASKGADADQPDMAELMRLKRELDAAKDQIARQRQELDQTRIIRDSFEQAVGSSADTEPKLNGSPTKAGNELRQTMMSPPILSGNLRPAANWDARSVMSDTPSVDNLDGSQNTWPSSGRHYGHANSSTGLNQQYQPGAPTWGQQGGRSWGNKAMANQVPQMMMPQHQQLLGQRTFSGPASSISSNDFNQFQASPGLRRSNTQNRATSLFPQVRENGWDTYGSGIGSLDGMTMGMNAGYPALNMYPTPMPYQPRPIGTPLSPTAAEFRAGTAASSPWNTAVSHLRMIA